MLPGHSQYPGHQWMGKGEERGERARTIRCLRGRGEDPGHQGMGMGMGKEKGKGVGARTGTAHTPARQG